MNCRVATVWLILGRDATQRIRDRGMRRQEQAHVLGGVDERPGAAEEQLERPAVVALDAQLERQHPGRAVSPAPAP